MENQEIKDRINRMPEEEIKENLIYLIVQEMSDAEQKEFFKIEEESEEEMPDCNGCRYPEGECECEEESPEDKDDRLTHERREAQ